MSVPNVRVDIAFSTKPDDAAPAWQDVTPRVKQSSGASISRGRSDEFSQVSAGTCSLVLDNRDGRFTAGNASSPYYPNVKIGRKIRVYTGSRAGNLLSAQDASLESTTNPVGDWTGGVYGYTASTVARSTTRAFDGSASLLVTWPTAGAGGSACSVAASGLSVGVTYTISGYVYVPAGNPAVLLGDVFGTFSTASTVTGSWQRLSVTITATSNTHYFGLKTNAASTAGQTVYLDAVMVEEGPTASTFTTTSAPPASFTGYVDEWPVQWAPGALWAEAPISATDRLKRLGQIAEFSNVVSEEVLADGPLAYYPLGEPTGATAAGDLSSGTGTLTISQIGTGGTITFGANTGPGTDGLPAPAFAAVDSNNGKYLVGDFQAALTSSQVSVRASFSTTVATGSQSIVRLFNRHAFANIELATAAGKLTGTLYIPYSATTYTITSTATVSDGATHDAIATCDGTTLTLYLDGSSVGTTSVASAPSASFGSIIVGGVPGATFTGTISHVAAYASILSAARIGQHNLAVTTGFAGESSNARVARYARWAGVPTAEMSLETGASTSIAFVDTTGAAPLTAMQDVVATENGTLFIDGAGVLTFQARTHRYNLTTPDLTVDAANIDTSITFKVNDFGLINDVTASRAGGITYRAQNAPSLGEYGSYRTSITLLTTSDPEVVSAASWRANNYSTPAPRASNVTLDLLTNPSLVTAIKALTIGDWLRIINLPAQAPASTVDLFIEGIAEQVSTQAWTVTFNTSPAVQSSAWVLGQSRLNQTTTLAY